MTQKKEKTLQLIKFALDQQALQANVYHIGKLGDEKRVFDKLCLLDAGSDGWIVAFSERGEFGQKSLHAELNTAALDFYWRLIRKDTFWEFRSAWEQEVGELF